MFFIRLFRVSVVLLLENQSVIRYDMALRLPAPYEFLTIFDLCITMKVSPGARYIQPLQGCWGKALE